MESKSWKLQGRILLSMNIEAVTGLHIGGASSGMEIGGVDNPVIRNPLSNEPYIPGSSLRGKMRSQLEKMLGKAQNQSIGQVKIHSCQSVTDFEKDGGCPVCHIFGVPGERDFSTSTLLVVRDVSLNSNSVTRLTGAQTDLAYTELKTEVAIDRVTSAASPRNLERVPAGAVFGPAEMVFSIYSSADLARFKYLLNGLQLIEDDYLGGSGSRGSGKVKFKDIKLIARVSGEDYASPRSYREEAFADLADFEKEFSQVEGWIRSAIRVE